MLVSLKLLFFVMSEFFSSLFPIEVKIDSGMLRYWHRMVARYAPPISYNFLNLIQHDDETVFEKVISILTSCMLAFTSVS